MNNNQSKIGIGIVIISLSASTYALEPVHNAFINTSNSSFAYADDLFFKLPHSIKLLDSKNKIIEVGSDNDNVVEIPIVKQMRFKFGKPKMKVFDI